MTPRLTLRKFAGFALISGLILFCSLCATSRSMAADVTNIDDGPTDFLPGADRGSIRPPATFFSINAVLAKLDRQRGRGPAAVHLASLAPANLATDALPAPNETPLSQEPFGLLIFRAPEGMLWRKWRGVQTDMEREQIVLDRCRDEAASCPPHAAQFLRLISAVKSKGGRAGLDEANRAVNAAIRYVSDYTQFGEADRWSAPLATFATAKGDCEDYAIAKYVALREAGFSREDLQLVLVRDRSVGQDHAVLAARLDGHWLLLDNRSAELIEDADATSFTPLFAIDHTGVHLFAAPYAKRTSPADEREPAPAAAPDTISDWSGAEANDDPPQLNTLPVLM